MRILAISGSLRVGSSNTAVLAAAGMLAPAGVEVVFYEGLATLPPFNPDLDTETPPAPVGDLRRRIGLADGVLICSPEYARGVAGVLKNALDWLVGSLEFPEKPVAVINASARAVHADAHLRLTLTTMSAHLVEPASITLAAPPQGLNAEAIAAQAETAEPLRAALSAFVAAIRESP